MLLENDHNHSEIGSVSGNSGNSAARNSPDSGTSEADLDGFMVKNGDFFTALHLIMSNKHKNRHRMDDHHKVKKINHDFAKNILIMVAIF